MDLGIGSGRATLILLRDPHRSRVGRARVRGGEDDAAFSGPGEAQNQEGGFSIHESTCKVGFFLLGFYLCLIRWTWWYECCCGALSLRQI